MKNILARPMDLEDLESELEELEDELATAELQDNRREVMRLSSKIVATKAQIRNSEK